jgi:hypothetical protein
LTGPLKAYQHIALFDLLSHRKGDRLLFGSHPVLRGSGISLGLVRVVQNLETQFDFEAGTSTIPDTEKAKVSDPM